LWHAIARQPDDGMALPHWPAMLGNIEKKHASAYGRPFTTALTYVKASIGGTLGACRMQ